MKSMKRLFLVFCAVSLIIGASGSAFAFQTLVQVDPTGNGTFATTGTTGITSFDWSDQGNLVIENNLVGSSGAYTTVQQWLNAALGGTATGSTATFNIHGQAVLGAYGGGGVVNHGTDVLGTDYEITQALDATETAQIVAEGGGVYSLKFTNISGTFAYFLGAANADPTTGTGYTDGTEILSGDLKNVTGNFNINGNPTGGSNNINTTILTNVVNTNYIDADPSGPKLAGTLLQTTVQYLTTLATNTAGATLNTGTPILFATINGGQAGQTPYDIQAGDSVLGADGNTTNFSAVPEPATMALLGLGLLGLAFVSRKKIKV
jgi:hypothetical protein